MSASRSPPNTLLFSALALAGCGNGAGHPLPTGKQQAGLSVSEALEGAARRARFGPDHTFTSVRSLPSQAPGTQLELFRPTYRGWPLRDQTLAFWVRDGRVIGVHDDLDGGVPSVVEPRLTPAQAEKRAVSALPPEWPRARLPTTRCELEIRNREPAPSSGEAERAPTLEYGCDLSSAAFEHHVSVNADSGEIESSYSLTFFWSPVVATGFDAFDMPRTFPAEFQAPSTYRLRTPNVETRDLQGGDYDDLASAEIVRNGSLAFVGHEYQRRAVSVHWALTETYEAYRETLDLEPWGDLRPDGRILAIANVDYDSPQQYAGFSLGTDHVLGPRIAFNDIIDAYAPEVAAHEATHFMSHAYGQRPENTGEPGAIEEGMAYALPELLDLRIRGAPDYVFDAFKALNPDPSVGPEAYQGAGWRPSDGIHHQGFLLPRWFALAAAGATGTNSLGTPYSVKAAGPQAMASILFEGKLALSGNDGFHKLKETTEMAARQICGEFSQAYASTRQAWHAVNLSSTPDVHQPYASPRWGQPRPQPWKTRLVWQTHALDPQETRWILQIAPTADFSHQVLELEADETDFENGTPVGVYELDLDPDTNYFWRVRRADTRPLHACWRPTLRFRTKDAAPVPISPVGAGHHPWRLPFRAQLAEGTSRVTIFISTTPDESGLLFSREFSAEEVSSLETGVEITVPKNREQLYWAASAINAGGTKWAQSNFVPFGTTDPKVQLQTPQHGSVISPWYVPYRWQELHGAEEYIVTIRQAMSAVDDVLHIGAPRHGVGKFYSVDDDPQHSWRVHAQGPRWGTEREPEAPETAELSRPSDTRSYALDFKPTRVTLDAPRWIPKLCRAPEAAVPVLWDRVDFAERVEVAVFPMYQTQLNAPPYTDYTDPLHVQTVAGDAYEASIDVAALPRRSSHHMGYKVAGRAFAVGDRAGEWNESDHGEFYVSPDRPVTLDSASFDLPWQEGWVHMVWSSDWAPWGDFRVEIYDNRGCTGSPVRVTTTSFGRVEGIFAFEVGPVSGPRSWRVRPNHDEHCWVADKWSDCRAADNTLPPPKPVIYGAYRETSLVGGWLPVPTGKVYALFEAMDAVHTYRVHVRETGMTGDGVLGQVAGSGPLLNRKGELLDAYCLAHEDDDNCPADPVTFLPGILIGELPTSFSAPEVAVKACNPYGCGPLSNWVTAL